MSLNLQYTHPLAKTNSYRANPISLYACALQGYPFNNGDTVPIRSGTTILIFTGVVLTWDDPSIVGFMSSVTNPKYPSLTIVNSGKVISNNNNEELYLLVTGSSNDMNLVTYGDKLAEIHFFNLAKVT